MAEAQDGRQALGGTAEAGARVQFSEWEQPCDQSDGGADGEGKPGAGLDDAENEAKCKRGPKKPSSTPAPASTVQTTAAPGRLMTRASK